MKIQKMYRDGKVVTYTNMQELKTKKVMDVAEKQAKELHEVQMRKEQEMLDRRR